MGAKKKQYRQKLTDALQGLAPPSLPDSKYLILTRAGPLTRFDTNGIVQLIGDRNFRCENRYIGTNMQKQDIWIILEYETNGAMQQIMAQIRWISSARHK